MTQLSNSPLQTSVQNKNHNHNLFSANTKCKNYISHWHHEQSWLAARSRAARGFYSSLEKYQSDNKTRKTNAGEQRWWRKSRMMTAMMTVVLFRSLNWVLRHSNWLQKMFFCRPEACNYIHWYVLDDESGTQNISHTHTHTLCLPL